MNNDEKLEKADEKWIDGKKEKKKSRVEYNEHICGHQPWKFSINTPAAVNLTKHKDRKEGKSLAWQSIILAARPKASLIITLYHV